MNQDRTIHAHYPGMEIVRYDRSGKWYLEPTDPRLPRQHIKLRDAVRQALWAQEHGGVIRLGRLGGTAFDRQLRPYLARAAGRS